MISSRAGGWVAAMLSAILLSACGPSTDDLEARVIEVKQRPGGMIEPIPQMKQFETFAYEAAGRRDPFTPTDTKGRGRHSDVAGIRPDLNRNKEPLEEYPLDALRMLGIIESAGKTYALVRAPDGVVHRVSVKDHLGQNYGEIVAVSEAEISLMEIIPDGFGGWMQRPATLALAQ
jgi:type IV pilus assembly protein PilP